MVSIPTSRDVGYVGTRSGRVAPSGPTPMVGAAMANLGQGLTQTAFNLNDLREQENADRLNNMSNEVSTELTRFLADEEQRFLSAREQTDQTGIGFTRQFMEEHQKRANDFAKRHFEGLSGDAQTGYLNSILSRGNSLYEKATAFEAETKSAYYERSTNTSLDTYRTQIGNNAADFEDLRRQGLAAIDATNMPEPWKAERRAQWDADAAESRWRWNFSQNPTQAVQDVRGPSSAKALLRKEEGFRETPYWDVNAWRIGYGSDTITRPDGTQVKVEPGMKITREDAERDLEYRLSQREGARAREQVGAQWAQLSGNTQAALESVAYNYGSLPKSVVAAARTGDAEAIASAVEKLSANPARRKREAAIIRGAEAIAHGGEDDRYSSIPYERRQQLAGWGETQISQQANQQRAQTKDTYSLMIAMNPEQVRESVILNDPNIDNGDKATLITSLRTAMKDSAAVNAMIGAMASGRVSVNPFDSDQTRIADKAYDNVMGDVSDPAERQAVTTDFIERSGHLPKRVQAELRQGVMSPDPAVLGATLSTADAYQRVAPIAFSAFEGSKAVGDKLEMYRHFVNNLGMSGEDAVDRIMRATDPARTVNRQVLKPEADKFTKNLTARDVTNAFGGWFSSPGAGLLPQQQSQLTAEFRELAEEAFYEVGGDTAAAKAIAIGEMKKRWNVSGISGKPHLMRQPPELHYPAVGGSHEYLRDDAMETAKSYVADLFPGREVENVAILADAETRADIENGRPPRYRLWYQFKEDGQTRYDEVFAGPWGVGEADIKTLMDSQQQSQRQQFDDRRAEAERTIRADTEAGAAADAAYDETVGPDWMRARAAEGARERANDGDRLNGGNLLEGVPYGTSGGW